MHGLINAFYANLIVALVNPILYCRVHVSLNLSSGKIHNSQLTGSRNYLQ